MNWNEVGEFFTTYALPALIALFYAGAAKYGIKFATEAGEHIVSWIIALKHKLNQNKIAAFMQFDDWAFDKLAAVVLAVQDSFVDAIKEKSADGKLTKEEADEARKLALEMFKASLTKEELQYGLSVLGDDFERYITAKIPAIVAQVKQIAGVDDPQK